MPNYILSRPNGRFRIMNCSAKLMLVGNCSIPRNLKKHPKSICNLTANSRHRN